MRDCFLLGAVCIAILSFFYFTFFRLVIFLTTEGTKFSHGEYTEMAVLCGSLCFFPLWFISSLSKFLALPVTNRRLK